jgi:ATP-dependent helicase HepA
MANDLYQILAASTQALRRRAEAYASGLGGALGVAAEPYPHQIATVARVLGDTTIRHLISDEVGLGKTVQALMILNALRLQNPMHAAIIVAPDRLISQWQNECWNRCHVQPSVFEDEGTAPDARVRLVRPQSLVSGAFVPDPDQYDLLLVDEPQTMSVQAMEVVERVAEDFRQVLILSASPGLSNPDRRRQLMHILEPDRAGAAELAGRDLDETFDALEKRATEDGAPAGAVYRTWSRARRILRAGRSDWQRYLPGRRHHHLECDPQEHEADWVRAGLRWAREEASSGTDTWRFGQALHRGPSAAREVIARQIRAKTSPLLAEAATAVASSPGDSRLDALVDILAGIWARDPNEQVIVVAGDAPSIAHISRRLSAWFADEDRPFLIDELRRAGEAQESEADDIEAMHAQLARFASGEARVLLIGEWIQAGLNLHFFARNVVFYSTPWDPEAIDQLIGRLDRLRPDGLIAGDRGRPIGSIDVWTLSQRGSPESEIVESLEALGVFQRPVPPAPEAEMASVDEGLRAIFAGQGARGVRQHFEALKRSWDEQPPLSQIEHLNPFTPKAAQAAYDRLQASPPVEPILLRSPRATYTTRCEEGLRGLTDILSRAHLFDVGSRVDTKHPGVRFSTIWYPGGRRDGVPFHLTELDRGPTWISGHAPFIYRRRDIGTPPRVTVHTDEGESAGRLLRFLDHGDPLHDGLLDGLIQLGARALGQALTPQIRTVRFPEGHPLLSQQGRVVLLLTAFGDAVRSAGDIDVDALLVSIEGAPTEAQRARLTADLDILREGWRADLRWARQQVPTRLLIDASAHDGRGWEALDPDLARAAFDPFAPGQRTVCARAAGLTTAPPPEGVVKSGLAAAANRLMAEFRRATDEAAQRIEALLSERDYQLAAEREDRLALRHLEIERRKAEPVTAQENLRAGRVAAAERRHAFADLAYATRREALRRVPGQLRAARPEFRSLLIRPAPLGDV